MRAPSRVLLGLLFSLAPRALCAQTPTAEPDGAPPPLPPRVLLQVQPCAGAGLEPERFARMLRAELAGDGVERLDLATPGAPADATLARLTVEFPACEAHPEQFLLAVDDAATRKSVRRVVDLSDVGATGRPRALALALAELLRASWLELTLPTAPEPAAPVPAPIQDAVRLRVRAVAPAQQPAPRTAPPGWSPSVFGAVEGRLFLQTSTGLGGFRLGIAALTPALGDGLRLRLRADGGAAFGGASVTLGDAEVWLATGGLALTVLRGSSVGFEVGGRVEVGATHGAGRLVAGRSPSGTSAGEATSAVGVLAVTGGLRGRLAAGLAGSLELDLGGVLGGLDLRAVDPVLGTDTRLAGVLGMSASLRLALAWER